MESGGRQRRRFKAESCVSVWYDGAAVKMLISVPSFKQFSLNIKSSECDVAHVRSTTYDHCWRKRLQPLYALCTLHSQVLLGVHDANISELADM